jgi:hypothetical protein
MRLIIEDHETLYTILQRADEIDANDTSSLEEENWKQKQIDEFILSLKKEGMVSTDAVELPHPMDFANFNAIRFRDVYSASIYMGARENWAFKDVSYDLIDRINCAEGVSGLSFVPTTSDGTGYLLDGENNSIACILEAREYKRSISIGESGACPLKFPNNIFDFKIDLARLESLANFFINTVMTSSTAKERNVQVFPNIDIHLPAHYLF